MINFVFYKIQYLRKRAIFNFRIFSCVRAGKTRRRNLSDRPAILMRGARRMLFAPRIPALPRPRYVDDELPRIIRRPIGTDTLFGGPIRSRDLCEMLLLSRDRNVDDEPR